jgi:hypothetical protein
MRSLSIVLLQEMAKFNILIRKMSSTLHELKKAIQGLAVMSQELDEMYLAFQNNVLPGIWRKVSYSSLKPLSSWFKDLLARVHFIREWLNNKAPHSYWMSGFYFPQGFLTGVLQSHARQYKIPIDSLSFKFKVLALEKEKLQAAPEVIIILCRMAYTLTDSTLTAAAGILRKTVWWTRLSANSTSRCQSFTSFRWKTMFLSTMSTTALATRPPIVPVCSQLQARARILSCRWISTPSRTALTSGPSVALLCSASSTTDCLHTNYTIY